MKVTPDNLIGKCIVNLFEKVTLDYNGLDQGALYLSLDKGEKIPFPLNLQYQNQIIKSEELEDAISIFSEIKQQNVGLDYQGSN